MKTRQLGEFQVSALGLGCMSMSQSYGETNRQESERTLHRALDIGYTFLDTASLYGLGHNEILLGEVLPERRNEFILASKCGIVDKDGFYKEVDLLILNPKSITAGELYGEFNLLTNEWKDGIVPKLVRDCVNAMNEGSDNRN